MRVALALLALAAASPAPAGERAHTAAVDDHHGGHEVPVDATAPVVTLSVVEDSVAGWNVVAEVTDFRFAPSRAGKAAVFGEGHAHLSLDGKKYARVYGTAFHLPDLPPGRHEISYSLHHNDHAAYLLAGEPIAATETITVAGLRNAAAPHHHHDHPPVVVPEGAAVPRVRLSVTRDPVSGWNLEAPVSFFEFAPAHAGSEPVFGEGHAHLYVDGRKVARLYGPAFHLSELTPGRHEIRVTLNANDHSSYVYDGEEIAASIQLVVPGVADAERRRP